MILKFTREINANQPMFFSKSIDIHYKLFQEDQTLESELYLERDITKIVCSNNEISIEDNSKLFGKSKYQIRDSNSQKIIGEIKIIGWGGNPFWQDVPSSPNAEIHFDSCIYYFRDVSSWNFPSLFRRKKQRIFDFNLYNIKGDEFSTYQTVFELPIFRLPNYFRKAALDGTITTNIQKGELSAIGLFLIQKSLEAEDFRSTD